MTIAPFNKSLLKTITTSLKAMVLTSLCTSSALAFGGYPDEGALTLGLASVHQGKAQSIRIQDLVGNAYTVSEKHDEQVLLGLGAFKSINDFFSFGLNVFYLPKTKVKGLIYQEHLFDNLSYEYGVSHLPFFFTLKGKRPLKNEKYAVTADVGIGPNIMHSSDYSERSRDGGITRPDNAFGSKTQTTFSATASLGLVIQNAIKNKPLTLAYRFMVLGNGKFKANNSVLLNTLRTGQTYAHNLTLTLTV